MKGRMILAIVVAILALVLTIWCFIDGTYYIGVFALCICIAQVCNYFLIKKKKYWYNQKHITIVPFYNWEIIRMTKSRLRKKIKSRRRFFISCWRFINTLKTKSLLNSFQINQKKLRCCFSKCFSDFLKEVI